MFDVRGSNVYLYWPQGHGTMPTKSSLKRWRTRTEPRSCMEGSQLRADGILTTESVEQTTFQSIDAASPVPPYAPGVCLFLAGRRGVATGHPPGAWDYTGKPRGAAGVRNHVSLLPRHITDLILYPLNPLHGTVITNMGIFAYCQNGI